MMYVFSVKDRVADSFDNPFFMPAVGMAIRGFTDAINDDKTHLYKHPDDYDLYRIGTFDPLTGALTPELPVQLALGKELVRSSPG